MMPRGNDSLRLSERMGVRAQRAGGRQTASTLTDIEFEESETVGWLQFRAI